jgi:hypothetical protein
MPSTILNPLFLLSSYPGELLNSYTKQFKWHTRDINMNLSTAGYVKCKARKTEVLTWNYEIKSDLKLV